MTGVVEQYLAAVVAHDWDAARACLREDVVRNGPFRDQYQGRDDYVADLYFYLTLEDSWKVSAVRRLALTGIIEGAYQYLKSKPTLTAEEKEELANVELLLAPDKALREWFGRNAARMNKLYEKSRGLKPGYVSEQRDPRSTEIKAQLKALNFATLEVHPDGNVEFVIGGVTDNTVGFLYSPGNQPPKMSPGSYIWIEEIAPKWFLFRTT